MNKKEFSQGTKRSIHFNVIDALIIVVLIAVVLGFYFRFNVVESLTGEENTEAYTVSFSVENIR